MRQHYEFVGQRVFKLFPAIAKMILAQADNKKLLYDYRDIALLSSIFSEYYGIDFPACLKKTSVKDSTDYRIKFTTLCLFCYDPETVKGPYFKRLKDSLRKHIADSMHTNHSLVSRYVSRARVYLQAYDEFETEIQQLVALTKLRSEVRNGVSSNKLPIVTKIDKSEN